MCLWNDNKILSSSVFPNLPCVWLAVGYHAFARDCWLTSSDNNVHVLHCCFVHARRRHRTGLYKILTIFAISLVRRPPVVVCRVAQIAAKKAICYLRSIQLKNNLMVLVSPSWLCVDFVGKKVLPFNLLFIY